MPPPTADQLQLIRDFEPVLFFHGGDATVPEERFFPSDAKRYLERCALWKATTPFLTPGDWGTNPVVERDKLGALPDEGAVFLGKGLPSGPFDFLETSSEQECFLDLAGWKPPGSPFPGANRYANLDRIAELYSDRSQTQRERVLVSRRVLRRHAPAPAVRRGGRGWRHGNPIQRIALRAVPNEPGAYLLLPVLSGPR